MLRTHASRPRLTLCNNHKRIFVMYVCLNCNIWAAIFSRRTNNYLNQANYGKRKRLLQTKGFIVLRYFVM